MDRGRQALSDERLAPTSIMNTTDDGDPPAGSPWRKLKPGKDVGSSGGNAGGSGMGDVGGSGMGVGQVRGLDRVDSGPPAAHVGSRPQIVRALSGGIGLLAQPRSSDKPLASSPLRQAVLDDGLTSEAQATDTHAQTADTHAQTVDTHAQATAPTPSSNNTFPSPSAATSSASAPVHSISPVAAPTSSLLFSPSNLETPVPSVLLDAPSPAPHITRSSPPPPSEPQPVLPVPVLATLDAPVGTASPRTPPNLRLEIPPPGSAQEASARDTLRAPFAPDSENEGICTEVGSLGQEIQLESGDHLNALERIYLYTQSKATFHRIFMSRALPTYLNEVTPTEAVEYVLPLLGGLAIDEEERVKEAFVAELLVIIWWFFTTCRVTDQELDPAVPPEAESGTDGAGANTEPPFVSVQSFSAVLASLLLSSNPEVSATARGTVVELLGRTRWIVKQGDQGGETLDEVQRTQYCETMRPVGSWSRGLLGPDEARMIQLEIIYGVIIDLGRLDLNGEMEEYAVEGEAHMGEGEVPYDLETNKSREDLSTLVGASNDQSNEPNYFVSDEQPHSTLALPSHLNSSILTDPALTPTAETVKAYGSSMYSPPLDDSRDSGEDRGSGFGSFTGPASVSSQNLDSASSFGLSNSAASSSSSSLELPSTDDPSLGISTPRSAPPTTTVFNPPSAGPGIGSGVPFTRTMSKSVPPAANGAHTSSTSSLNLPELSPADSSSRSSVASPAEPISPPEDAGAEYLTGEDYMTRPSRAHTNKSDDSEKTVEQDTLSVPGSGFSSSLSSDAGTDELIWHTPRGGEGFETGYFDPPTGAAASPTVVSNGASPTLLSNGSSPTVVNTSNPSIVTSGSSPPSAGASPTVAFNGGLAPYTRPMLGRQDSMMSIGSEVNPEEYADAESGGEWDEDVPEPQPATTVDEATTENEGGVVEEVTPVEVPLEADGIDAEGAYIDDGAAAEEAAIGRVASMSLIAAVTSSGVVDDEIYTLFVDEVIRVSADPVYWVRSETSYALGTLAKVVPEDTIGSYLLPILEALMTDTECHVRQSSVFAIPSFLKRLSPQRRRDLTAQYVLKLCEDTAETVRTGALQVLAEVIHTFHGDEDGPPTELVDFFLKGENDQVHAPLPKPPVEEKTPLAEKDRYSEWGPQPSTWGEPSSYFEIEPSFPEPDRALICAFNYPALALTLGPEQWSRLAGYYKYLAEESWHTPKVRSTLAASAGEIARIVGPRAARTDVLPVWWICLSSDQREAKIKALKALPMLLEALDAEGRVDVAAKLGEAWAEHVSGWKERETFARQLRSVVPLLESEGLVLCRIFKSGLEDRVAAIREAVIEALPVLHEVLKDDVTHTKMARDDLFTLGASGTCRQKTTFLASCRALVESSQGASILDDSRFGPSITPLAEDSVIDVRIALGRLLTTICEHHMHTQDQRPKWLVDCLERLSLDPSSDVRSFVHRAATAEYVEPRTTVSKPKPDDRPSSPLYAEFSRPP